mmetsp:Transcript_16860/g.37220  ORF Transcript_16860/g.37220 Transcript_16860/m.37220 type:complete len:168 (+) Transcript_16860:51-554(+)|eukprot:CAMPEP_0204257008 /NCGR_PEP_ID=MMETSP0468-20130131/4136_1 /ASSEMBLY_ACC=CAM_ASM_000383 /TAXON_ID=2969 /ORGANISM="Oxyrrhis marina" /LENGTH=167 /DNA_ID=CAMNT_0051231045 /DNA_START=44 /DNA_END=547 /DNA_ORIENTATION=-
MAKVADTASGAFATKEYDVIDVWKQMNTCCLSSRRLILEPEEVVLVDSNPCCTSTKRAPYGEIGAVEKGNVLCCVGISMPMTGSGEAAQPISPGCGCSEALVNEIVEELKKRIQARGDQGQIQRTEQTQQLVQQALGQVAHLNVKIDLIMKELKIQPPPAMVVMDAP